MALYGFRRNSVLFFTVLALVLFIYSPKAYGSETEFQFYSGGIYDTSIPSPEKIMGFAIGDQPVRYPDAVKYFQILSESSSRCRLIKFGETFEGRALHYLVVSNRENMQQLEKIRADIRKLSNPVSVKGAAEATEIIAGTPAVAWMMYGIHGDELSGPDAAVQLAYQLVAGEDSVTRKIRQESVICIHPMENPDGRERFLAQMQQWNGFVPNTDVQSIHHTGDWPWGRGNHYLFDLNRDWFLLVNPETRARVWAILDWNPQLIVDAHEMGALDTYLFSPAREPINPHISTGMLEWSHIFAREQANALDQYGWSYYTREWLDEWYPGYGSSWPLLLGSVGILYEQAGTDGSSIKKRDGTIFTYREAVHHQFISSMANLTTLADNSQKILKDYYHHRKQAIEKKSVPMAVFYVVPDDNSSRLNLFMRNLLHQNISVEIAEKEFTVQTLHGYLESKPVRKTLPRGTCIIRLNQPLRSLIEAIFEFDPRMTAEFLRDEREEILRKKSTRMYEVSSWSLPMAYGLEAYWAPDIPGVASHEIALPAENVKTGISEKSGYGYICGYQDDASVKALVQLLEAGAMVRIAEEPFSVGGQKFARGALLLRNHENGNNLEEQIRSVIESTGVDFFPVSSALAQQGPDLGGNQFRLLTAPRIALLSGPEINLTSFSSLWYLLDHDLRIRHSILNSDRFGGMDLQKYNVLILPSAWSSDSYKSIFREEIRSGLKTWIEGGGTLIAIEEASAFICDTSTGLSKTRIVRQNLKNRDFYRKWMNQRKSLFSTIPDSSLIWESTDFRKDTTEIETISGEQLKWLQKQDELARLFQPRGAILRAKTDPKHWMNFGLPPEVPVILYTSYAYMAMDPVEIPARFSDPEILRLSGLLWPEARQRWAETPYITVEHVGKGQIILFAGEPFFRAYFHGSLRFLINAMLLGPGFGTVQGVPW